MNKKFLSAILFGALMVTSTGTFVSCKDYDEDIENLQAQINAQKADLTAQVSTLTTALNTAKAEAAAAKADAAAAKEAAAAAKAAAIEEALKAVEELKASVSSVSKEEYDAMVAEIAVKIAAVDEGLNKLGVAADANDAALAALETQLAALNAYKADAEDLDAVNAAIASINAAMKDIASNAAIKETDEKITAVIAQVAAISEDLVTLQGKSLRSMVFVPKLYIDGVEATEYAFGLSNAIGGVASAGEWEQGGDDAGVYYSVVKGQVESYEGIPVEWYVNPVWNVEYHLNPASAVVETEQLAFASRDAEYVKNQTRAAYDNMSKAKPAVANSKVVNGILTVGYKAEGKSLRDVTVNNDIATMALKATIEVGEKDTTITSDYAQLYPSQVIPQVISFSQKNYGSKGGYGRCGSTDYYHLAKTADEAINHQAPLTVEYDAVLDLTEYLNIHYNQHNCYLNDLADTKTAGDHKVWAYGEEAQFNLDYRFSLVEYVMGDWMEAQETKENRYGYVDDETGIFEPRYVDENGNSVKPADGKGVSAVGRKPVVRVEVYDKTTGAIILGGFLKVKITRTIAPKFAPVFDFGLQSYLACTPLYNETTWAQYSNLLLETAAVTSKAEFEQLYVLDSYTSDDRDDHHPLYQGWTKEGYAYIYVQNANGQMVKIKDLAEYDYSNFFFGSIAQYGNTQGVANDVLSWDTYQYERDNIYDANDKHCVTYDVKGDVTPNIYICYKPRPEVGEGTSARIYVPVKLGVRMPLATYGKKIDNYWTDGNNVKNGGEFQRLNVPYPVNGGNTLNYVVDLDNAFVGNGIQFEITNNEDGLFDETWASEGYIKYNYYFDPVANAKTVVGASGTEYVLEVASSGGEDCYAGYNNVLKVKGTNTVIATVDQSSQTALGSVTYANNEISKDLLNAYGHNHPNKDAFYATMVINAYNECCQVLDTWNFEARFLRPIDAEYKEDGKFTDAEANGSTIAIADLFDFQDWRDVKFVDGTNFKNAWLFAYYGVKGVKIDIEHMETNLAVEGDTSWKALKKVSNQVVFTQIKWDGTIVNTIDACNNYNWFDLSDYNDEDADQEAVYVAVRKAMGKIKYENNGSNVESFKVRIPVELVYDWGTLVFDNLEFDVENTLGN